MKKLALLLALALPACAAEQPSATDHEAAGAPATEAVSFGYCNPVTVFAEFLRSHEKATAYYVGLQFLSDGSATTAVYTWYQQADSRPRVSRGLGLQRQGRNVIRTASFDIYACEFEVCDIYDLSVTCNCSYCQQIFPEGGPQGL